jgi:hypothetical protein
MFFTQRAVPKSKEGIAKFLIEHPRYSDGGRNSQSTYAHNVKVTRLGLTPSELDKAYTLMEAEDYRKLIRGGIRDFQSQMDGRFMIETQGRSGGYLTLFEAEVYDPGYKSTCKHCSQLNFQEVSEKSSKCGVCGGPRVNLKKPLAWSRLLGSGIDHRVTYDEMLEWDKNKLLDRLDVVHAFDAACDVVRNDFKRMLNEYMLVEEVINVPTRVTRLQRLEF